MAILRYDPWRLIHDLNEGYAAKNSPLRDDEVTQWTPAVDIKEDATKFLVVADLPGVAADQIDIAVENGLLTIRGERFVEKEAEGQLYSRLERHSGKFSRRFKLPETADLDNIKAKNKHGVLEVTIPKLEKLQSRKISVEE